MSRPQKTSPMRRYLAIYRKIKAMATAKYLAIEKFWPLIHISCAADIVGKNIQRASATEVKTVGSSGFEMGRASGFNLEW